MMLSSTVNRTNRLIATLWQADKSDHSYARRGTLGIDALTPGTDGNPKAQK